MKMNDKIIDLEARSLRENLIFYGIEEKGTQDNPIQLVIDIIVSKLHLSITDMAFDRTHRMRSDRAPKTVQ